MEFHFNYEYLCLGAFLELQMRNQLRHHPDSPMFWNIAGQIERLRETYGHDNRKCTDPQCPDCATLRCPNYHPTHVQPECCVVCNDDGSLLRQAPLV